MLFLVTIESESPKLEVVSVGHGIKARSPHRNLWLLQLAACVVWCGVAALVRVSEDVLGKFCVPWPAGCASPRAPMIAVRVVTMSW